MMTYIELIKNFLQQIGIIQAFLWFFECIKDQEYLVAIIIILVGFFLSLIKKQKTKRTFVNSLYYLIYLVVLIVSVCVIFNYSVYSPREYNVTFQLYDIANTKNKLQNATVNVIKVSNYINNKNESGNKETDINGYVRFKEPWGEYDIIITSENGYNKRMTYKFVGNDVYPIALSKEKNSIYYSEMMASLKQHFMHLAASEIIPSNYIENNGAFLIDITETINLNVNQFETDLRAIFAELGIYIVHDTSFINRVYNYFQRNREQYRPQDLPDMGLQNAPEYEIEYIFNDINETIGGRPVVDFIMIINSIKKKKPINSYLLDIISVTIPIEKNNE